MEAFAQARARLSGPELQRFVRIETLPQWCAGISEVYECRGERGEINCLWGRFRVHREVIRDGVRFSLPGCPNALQWTLTAEHAGSEGRITVHCSINRAEPDPDFADSIEEFVRDWCEGLEQGWEKARQRAARQPVEAECMPWYG